MIVVRKAGEPEEKPKKVARGRAGGETSAVVDLDDANFGAEVLESSLPVLVDFTASWCGPCQTFEPVLEQFARETQGRCKVARLDVDRGPRTSDTYGIKSVPTLIVVRGGQVVTRRAGPMSPGVLRELLARAR
jgi:thioredoxin